jgi:hypothetical protein
MSLVTPAEVQAMLDTDLEEEELQVVIDREEAAMVKRIGPHYDPAQPLVEIIEGGSSNDLFLPRVIKEVVTVTEARRLGNEATELTTDDYHAWRSQGRIVRLPRRLCWGAEVTVTYHPEDDNEARKVALIELIRLSMERTPLKSESVAGEYSYTAPDWDAVRERLLCEFRFPLV